MLDTKTPLRGFKEINYHAREGREGYHGQVRRMVARTLRHAVRRHLAVGLTISEQTGSAIKQVFKYMHKKLPEGKFLMKANRKMYQTQLRRMLQNMKARAKKGMGASAHPKV